MHSLLEFTKHLQCFNHIQHSFSGDSGGKASAFNAGNCLQCRRPRFDPWVGKIPGEENGNHSSILAWEIPRVEELDELHGVTRVRHDLVTKPPPPI